MGTQTHKIDKVMKELFDRHEITFNEWLVIAMAVHAYKVDPILPPEYEEARQNLIKLEVD